MHDRDGAQQLMEDELSDPRYQRPVSGPIREAIDDFLRWLEESAVAIGGVHIPVGPLLIGLLVTAAIVTVLLVVRPRLQRSASTPAEVDIDAGVSAAELRVRADRHAASEKYDDAARDRFRAVVRAAEERSLLRGAEGRTATEVAQQLAAVYGELARELHRAADQFNLSRYGGKPLDRDHHQQMQHLDEQLEAARPHSPAKPKEPRLEVPG